MFTNAKKRVVMVAISLTAFSVVYFGIYAGTLEPPRPPSPTQRTPIFITDLPLTITSPGSYFFAENLDASGIGGIVIDADNVTIDFMGFSLSNGNGVGVVVTTKVNSVLKNGIVSGWSGSGVEVAGAQSLIKNLNSYENGGYGMLVADGALLVETIAAGNDLDGIKTGSGGIVLHCVAKGNLGDGIVVSQSSNIVDSNAFDNLGNGFVVKDHTSVDGSAATNNTLDGIKITGQGSKITNCTAAHNGNGVGDGAGIHVASGMGGNRIDGNNVFSNDRGIDVDVAGNLIIRNSLSANTMTYDIIIGNTVGPKYGVADPIVGENPWANFSY